MTDRERIERILNERAYPGGYPRLKPGQLIYTISGSLSDNYHPKLLFEPYFLQATLGEELVSTTRLLGGNRMWPAWIHGHILMGLNEAMGDKSALETLYDLCFKK